ncbi:restriction endonuclease subunit S [Halomonas sp. CSM-2]|uniref:restriction endonuclease subunit S n=1 Tax=Halomonas sp. CSM-2 TaxID=1975722 RepID=UPI000A2846D8|nr:restriction endonuclease subunit S [Halomonas sp. CSM-2]
MFEEQPLGCLVKRHIGGGTPSRQMKSFWKGPIPWASVKDFKDDQVSLSETEEYISPEGLSASASNLIPENTVVICSRMAVGRAAITALPIAINQDLKALFARDGMDERYLLRLLHWVKVEAEKKAVGSTVKGIRIADLLALEVPIAPEDEQPAIANILDTLDTQIRQTEAIIAKLQQVKQGLLHDLLTRGIDENGQLRPPCEQAPELYKESPLGWIPKEWRVSAASEFCTGIIDCKNRTPPESPDDYAVIKTSNIKQGVLIEDGLTYTDERSYQIWTARGEPKAGDVVITREAPIGESFIIEPTMPKMCLGQRMMLYRPDLQKARPEFLHLSIMFELTQRRLLDLAGGSTVGHVRVGDVRDFLFSLPETQEQRRIEKYAGNIKGRLSFELLELQKLKKQKAGLMDDLLTGRVRVTELIEQQHQAS